MSVPAAHGRPVTGPTANLGPSPGVAGAARATPAHRPCPADQRILAAGDAEQASQQRHSVDTFSNCRQGEGRCAAVELSKSLRNGNGSEFRALYAISNGFLRQRVGNLVSTLEG